MTILETVSSEPAAEPFTKSEKGEVKPANDVGVLYRLCYLLQRTQRHGGPSFRSSLRSGDAVLVSFLSVDVAPAADFIHQPHPTASRPLPVRWWPPPRGLLLFPAHLLLLLCFRPVATSLIGILLWSVEQSNPFLPFFFNVIYFKLKTSSPLSLISPFNCSLFSSYFFTVTFNMYCFHVLSTFTHTGQMHVFPLFAIFLLHTCLALP